MDGGKGDDAINNVVDDVEKRRIGLGQTENKHFRKSSLGKREDENKRVRGAAQDDDEDDDEKALLKEIPPTLSMIIPSLSLSAASGGRQG